MSDTFSVIDGWPDRQVALGLMGARALQRYGRCYRYELEVTQRSGTVNHRKRDEWARQALGMTPQAFARMPKSLKAYAGGIDDE